MQIIIIILLALVLYYSGFIKRFLTACSIPDDTPATTPIIQETQKKVIQDPAPDLQNISRLELEKAAAAWMQQRKIKHWYIISRIAPNDVLIEIITDNKTE